MQRFLWILADIVKYSAYLATAVYSPFAKTWGRALAVPFILVCLWGAIRVISIFRFHEETPPGIYFLILPSLYLVYSSLIRRLKLLIFKWPPLTAFEESVRAKIKSIGK